MHQILKEDAKKIMSALDNPVEREGMDLIFSDGMFTSFKIIKDGRVIFTPLEGHSVTGSMIIKRYVMKPDNILWLIGDSCSATLEVVDECTSEHKQNFWITDDDLRSIGQAIRDQDTQYIEGEGGWTFINGNTPIIEFNSIKFGFNRINTTKRDITLFHEDHRMDYMIFVKKQNDQLR